MATTTTSIKEFKLHGVKDGKISVAHVTEPYGEKSTPVVSIGISLNAKSDEPDWKSHIPYENLDDLILALQHAKKEYS